MILKLYSHSPDASNFCYFKTRIEADADSNISKPFVVPMARLEVGIPIAKKIEND